MILGEKGGKICFNASIKHAYLIIGKIFVVITNRS